MALYAMADMATMAAPESVRSYNVWKFDCDDCCYNEVDLFLMVTLYVHVRAVLHYMVG